MKTRSLLSGLRRGSKSKRLASGQNTPSPASAKPKPAAPYPALGEYRNYAMSHDGVGYEGMIYQLDFAGATFDDNLESSAPSPVATASAGEGKQK